MVKCSFIFLTFNRWGIVSRCFKSLIHTLIEEGHEWIILDNGSDDGTAEMLAKMARRYPIKLKLSARNLGVAGGRELLFDAAQNPIIISLDSDVEATTRDFYHDLAETVQAPAVGLAGVAGWHINDQWKLKQAPRDATLEVDILSGYCHVFRRELLQKVRLDKTFNYFGCEDDDLSFQMREQGLQVWQVGSVPINHIFSGSWNTEGYLRNRALFRAKWERRGIVGTNKAAEWQTIVH